MLPRRTGWTSKRIKRTQARYYIRCGIPGETTCLSDIISDQELAGQKDYPKHAPRGVLLSSWLDQRHTTSLMNRTPDWSRTVLRNLPDATNSINIDQIPRSTPPHPLYTIAGKSLPSTSLEYAKLSGMTVPGSRDRRTRSYQVKSRNIHRACEA